MSIYSYDKKGFTLLEIMMAVGISGIVILMIATLSKRGMVYFGQLHNVIDTSVNHSLIRKFLVTDLLNVGPSYNYLTGGSDNQCYRSDGSSSDNHFNLSTDFWNVYEVEGDDPCRLVRKLNAKNDEFKFLRNDIKGEIKFKTPDHFNQSTIENEWKFGKDLFCSFLSKYFSRSIVKVVSLTPKIKHLTNLYTRSLDYAIIVKVDTGTTCSIVKDDLYPIDTDHLTIKEFVENIPAKTLAGAGLLFLPVHLIKYQLKEDVKNPTRLNLYRIKYDYDALSSNDKKQELMLAYDMKELKFRRNKASNYLINFSYKLNELKK